MRSDSILLYYLVAFVVLALVVGILLVWVVVGSVRNRRRKPEGPLVMPGHAELQAAAANPPADEDTEVLRVLRDVRSGVVYLEVEGTAYRTLTDIRSPEVGRLVLQTVSELARFTRGVTPAVAAPAAAPPPPLVGQRLVGLSPSAPPPSVPPAISPDATPAPGSLARRGEALIKPTSTSKSSSEPLKSTEPERELPPIPTADLRPLSTGTGPLRPAVHSTGPLRPPTQQRVDMKSFWERALSRPTAFPGATGPRPLADELEDVLSELIRSSPKAPPVEVHFKTAEDGHLVIEVNGVDHSNASDISDPIGRQIVQTVVKKWESG